jgi:hypothetical protein
VSTITRRPTRTVRIDAVCAGAVELAREAAEEVAGRGGVGTYLGCEPEGERSVTHYFTSNHGGYVGWRWAVSVARAPRTKAVTIDEVAMLPGTEAILAPRWLPWSERVQAGDLGPGDLLPAAPDDPRLVPGYLGPDDTDASDSLRVLNQEVGLGRVRVLSVEGRDEAAERWYTGTHGPDDPIAQAAPHPCATCGFFVSLAGPLGTVFGVCSNEYSPSDGQVVAFAHGCGAHSEIQSPAAAQEGAEPAQHVLDTLGYDDAEPDAR